MPDDVVQIEVARIDDVLMRAPGDVGLWLSASEKRRLAGLRHDGRRREYLAGHWLAREQLARLDGSSPGDCRLEERKGLPPGVEGGRVATWIAITHSGRWVAAAVAGIPLGIDLEQRPRALDASLEVVLLNRDELAGSLDADALLQRWVAKEAWIKRRGESALPSRLRQLQLVPASWEAAEVRVESHPEFHFAVALAAGWERRRCAHPGLCPAAGFSVLDLAGEAAEVRSGL